MKEPNKKRRSIRLKDFDYSQPAGYSIAICTHDRKSAFGEIVDGEMRISQLGCIVEEEWKKTPLTRNNVMLDAFVVMPNHIHGIIIFNDDCTGTSQHAPTMERFGKPTHNSVPTIIRLFKSATTKRVNELRNSPAVPLWQRNYYEHIIHGEKDSTQRAYIVNNPLQWQYDRENDMRIPDKVSVLKKHTETV